MAWQSRRCSSITRTAATALTVPSSAATSGGWVATGSPEIAHYFDLAIVKKIFPSGVMLHTPAAVASQYNSVTTRPYAWESLIDVYFGAQCMDDGKNLKLTGSWQNAAVAVQSEQGNPIYNNPAVSMSNPIGPTANKRNFYCVTAN